jgi:hypothetical protein
MRETRGIRKMRKNKELANKYLIAVEAGETAEKN